MLLPKGAGVMFVAHADSPSDPAPIVDVAPGRLRALDPLAVLDRFLAGGATFIQLRDKGGTTGPLVALADAAGARTRAAGARLIVNDRADVAKMAGADGVHVGQDDLPVEDVRAVLGPDAIVGVSTHDETQIDRAIETSASYIAVGPIHVTSTKDTGYTARGLDLVRYAAARASREADRGDRRHHARARARGDRRGRTVGGGHLRICSPAISASGFGPSLPCERYNRRAS